MGKGDKCRKRSKQSGVCRETGGKRDRNEKKVERIRTNAIGKIKDTPEEGAHFPSVVYGYYRGFRTL